MLLPSAPGTTYSNYQLIILRALAYCDTELAPFHSEVIGGLLCVAIKQYFHQDLFIKLLAVEPSRYFPPALYPVPMVLAFMPCLLTTGRQTIGSVPLLADLIIINYSRFISGDLNWLH